jgi:WD40 repeat protein
LVVQLLLHWWCCTQVVLSLCVQLAVGAGTTVYLYEPEGSDSSSVSTPTPPHTTRQHMKRSHAVLPWCVRVQLRWRYACMLEQGTEVAALAWSPAEEHMLAVCGEEVTLWNVDNTTREWSVRSGDAVSQCAFSPDGHYLATVAQYQPLVKVALLLLFIYLLFIYLLLHAFCISLLFVLKTIR